MVMGGYFKTVGLAIAAMALVACQTFDPTDPFASPGEFYDSKSREELLAMARKGDYEAIRRLSDTPLQNLEARAASGEYMAMMQLALFSMTFLMWCTTRTALKCVLPTVCKAKR